MHEAGAGEEGGWVDRDAGFEAFFRAHSPGAYRLALRLSGDPHLAEECVAEVFALLYRRRHALELEAPGAYVRQSVVNRLSNGWRRRTLERPHRDRKDGDDRGGLAFDERVVDRHRFRIALDQLSDRQRTAVVLRYYEGLTEAETADAMGCATGTVKSLTHRGLARLRPLLEAGDASGGAV